ncbi:MAG: DegT/DnrJ/EryC1/StrS family aminotransferase [Planctomycetes bacterium]|nr:DegT/DnrJ/EryC1/StrS family aminotransferase [Planctomycetota bacterium]
MLNEIKKLLEDDQLSGFRGTADGNNGGPMVQRLEKSIADYFDIKHAIVFNSATAALHAALVACGVRKTDEVIVSPYSFTASASCVLQAGAKPVFADIDADSYCISPTEITKVKTANTKVLLPVHLCGNVADMDGILALAAVNGYKVIEDAAQALGAKYKGKFAGTIGDCGVFSFNQSKNISTGEGGCLITNNDTIAKRAKLVRNHGEVVEPEAKILGWNYRMTEIEACIGYHRFQRLDEVNRHRQAMAQHISENLATVTGLNAPVVATDTVHSFYTYAMKVTPEFNMTATELCQRMEIRDFPLKVGYVKPLHLQPIFANGVTLPVAEKCWNTDLIVTDIIKEHPQKVSKFVDVLMRSING